MKLRNKKTGEIKEWSFAMLQNIMQITEQKHYNSLSDLNEEWEDYEEPKTFWAISWAGEPEEYDVKNAPQELKDIARSIGNYFETEEEAEKAVEKLKAWTRLKDNCGISFSGLNMDRKGRPVSVNLEFNNEGKTTFDEAVQNVKDLTLLFGGEE